MKWIGATKWLDERRVNGSRPAFSADAEIMAAIQVAFRESV